jgi:sec-independent protein translocase protein TatC
MVALALGVLLTLPLIAREIYMFINPALYVNEKKHLYTFVASFAILFSIGVVYAYFILLPTTFHILYRLVYQSNIIPLFSVKDFFNMVAVGMLGSGLFYTFPLVIYLLVKADLIEVNTLKNNRKELLVGLLIVTAILTPDPTPFSMLLMSVPFYLLFELTIQILSRGAKKSKEEVFQRGLVASREILSKSHAGGE